MLSVLGLQKSRPGRQVVCLAGDGGLSMLFGDLITVVQEQLPIKIAVYDNDKLGFVEIEQRAEGMLLSRESSSRRTARAARGAIPRLLRWMRRLTDERTSLTANAEVPVQPIL